jgi:hypothetical protein
MPDVESWIRENGREDTKYDAGFGIKDSGSGDSGSGIPDK